MQTPRKPDGRKARKEWRKANAEYRKMLRLQRTAYKQIYVLNKRGVMAGREIDRLRRIADVEAAQNQSSIT